MGFFVFNGEEFLKLNENQSLGFTSNYREAVRFRKKLSALNVAMRQPKKDNKKWAILDSYSVSNRGPEISYKEELSKLQQLNADYIVPVDSIVIKYCDKGSFNQKDLLNKEISFFKKYNRFENPIKVNASCVLINDIYTYLAAKELNIKEIPVLLEPDFYKYLEDEITRKHNERIAIRKKVFSQANGKCLLCGKQLQNDNPKDIATYMTIDHIFPKSKGGENDINNYQCLCQKCNRSKGDVITPFNKLIDFKEKYVELVL